jgi:hypothetical protein
VGVEDVPAIASAMIALLGDGAAREALRTAAAARLPCFAWARAAVETLTVLEQVGRAR